MAESKRILIVDDDLTAPQTYGFVLGRDGYEIVTAETAAIALKELESRGGQFDLVLSDLRMPTMTGLELLAETQERFPGVPFVLVTAFGTSAIAAASKRMGASDFIQKLADVEELRAIVRRNLHRQIRAVKKARPTSISHAAWRWTCLVAPLAHSQDDLPTIADWAMEVGSAPSTIKVCCSNVGVRAKESLNLGRALRVVIKHAGSPCEWSRILRMTSPSTLSSFLGQAGLGRREALPMPSLFLARQTFIADDELLRGIDTFIHSPFS